MLKRRAALRAIALSPMAIGPGGPAHADGSTAPNVIVYCDPPLRGAIGSVGRGFDVRTNVFCAAPWMMLAQIERTTQNDILVSSPAALDEGERRQLVKPGDRVTIGNDRLALVVGADQAGANDPRALIGAGPLAMPDATALTTIDGVAALARFGLTAPYPFQLMGAADGEDVGFLVRSGAARVGLMHATEARTWGLSIAALLPDPIPYAAAISAVTRSPNAGRYLEFLRTAQARARLREAGLAPAT